MKNLCILVDCVTGFLRRPPHTLWKLSENSFTLDASPYWVSDVNYKIFFWHNFSEVNIVDINVGIGKTTNSLQHVKCPVAVTFENSDYDKQVVDGWRKIFFLLHYSNMKQLTYFKSLHIRLWTIQLQCNRLS